MKDNTSVISKRKKMKFGATAILFTCVIIASVIILNVVFYAFSEKHNLWIDMTRAQLYTLSDASSEILDGNINKEITIYFCQPLDKLTEDETSNMVYKCAKQYEEKYENVKIDSIDIITNPAAIEKYANSSNSRIKTTSVVVASDTDFRTFTIDSFYATNEDQDEVLAFNGEVKFTTAIMQLCSDSPIAYFSTGHGETTGSEGNRPAIWTLFETAGYDVREINLSNETMDEEAQVLIVNGPKYDFTGFGVENNEIDKIGSFINDLGNLMVFLDPNTGELPELESLLYEWGVKVEPAVIKDFSNGLSTDGTKLDAVYTTDELGSSLHNYIRSLDSTPKTVVEYARPISIVWGVDGTSLTDNISKREASVVLSSYDTAKAYSYQDEDTTLEAPFNLMTITRETNIIDNDYYYSYVMVTGTTNFASDDYLYNTSYANDEILYAAMRLMGKETVPNNISYKFLEDESLDITNSQANTWTVIVTAVLPVIILSAGIVVAVRRKHL